MLTLSKEVIDLFDELLNKYRQSAEYVIEVDCEYKSERLKEWEKLEKEITIYREKLKKLL